MTEKNKGLQRPIICICNDRYVASLKDLRNSPYVKLINFEKPKQQRLLNRIKVLNFSLIVLSILF